MEIKRVSGTQSAVRTQGPNGVIYPREHWTKVVVQCSDGAWSGIESSTPGERPFFLSRRAPYAEMALRMCQEAGVELTMDQFENLIDRLADWTTQTIRASIGAGCRYWVGYSPHGSRMAIYSPSHVKAGP